MVSPTGCISIQTVGDDIMPVQRVIEYLHLDGEGASIWVDVFLYNPSSVAQSLLLIHRGSLSAEDVTNESWPLAEAEPSTVAQCLTRRITRLHKTKDPLDLPGDGTVMAGGIAYRIWENRGPRMIEAEVGDKESDVPFTMWEVGPFGPKERHVFRLELTMAAETYEEQIGGGREFYAYGESILLNKIEYEDLPCYDQEDRERYERAFARFKGSMDKHTVPDIFEYLVVCPDGMQLGYETTPISPMLLPQSIVHDDLRENTRWFTTDNSHSAEWSLVGKRYNGFIVKVAAKEGVGSPCVSGRSAA